MDSPISQKFPCDLCGFKTAHKSSLRDHINGVHLGVKPHKCDKCDFATAHYNSLAAHKKIPHLKCEQCPFIAVGKGGKGQSNTASKEMRVHEENNHGTVRGHCPIIKYTNGTEPVASNGSDEDFKTTEHKVSKRDFCDDSINSASKVNRLNIKTPSQSIQNQSTT